MRRMKVKNIILLFVIFLLVTKIPRILLWIYPDPRIPFSTFFEMMDYLSTFISFVSTRNFYNCLEKRSEPLSEQYAAIPRSCTDQTNLLFLIKSSIYRNSLRHSLRTTWAKNVSSSISHIFLIGSRGNEPIISLMEENNKYGDILQGPFMDTMSSVAHKVIMGLGFAKHNCRNVRYIIIADDDSLLVPWNLLPELETLSTLSFSQYFYSGFVYKNRRPIRNPYSRWFVPRSAYDCNIYPKYAGGELIIINSNMLSKLVQLSHLYNTLPMDDIMIAVMAKMSSVNAVELDFNQHVNCQDLLTVHKSENSKDLIVCHGADDHVLQKLLWLELCYTTISTKSDTKLMKQYCTNSVG